MTSRSRSALILAAAIGASGLTALPAHAAGAVTYYVDISNQACTDSGSGTAAAPFCHIQTGVDAAAPGDTVAVSTGKSLSYSTGAVISGSGTADAPITIVATIPQSQLDYPNALIWETDGKKPAFTISGASHVVLRGFGILNYTGQPLVTIQNSSDVTVDGFNQSMSRGDGGSGAITVDGASSGITVSRSILSSVTIASGASDVTVTTDSLRANAPLLATDVSGLTITNNTIWHYCPSGIDVEGASQNVSIENNIVTDAWGWGPGVSGGFTDCAGRDEYPRAPAQPEVTVSAQAAATTVSDYNDLFTWQTNQTAMYSWNGVVYATLAAFGKATGQGMHDIAAMPWPDQQMADYPPQSALIEGSADIDSGDATAPGVLATDILGHSRVDDPYMADTGSGAGYVDRGAYEFVPNLSSPATLSVAPVAGTYPLTVTATAMPPSGWTDHLSYSFNFNDGTGWISGTNSVQHTYAGLGPYSAGIDVRITRYNAVATAHDADSVTVTPSDVPLTAQLAVNFPYYTGGTPIPVTASAAGTTDGAPIASYSFNFGDGSKPVVVQAADGNSTTHPMSIGVYTVTLTVTDVLGHTATASRHLVTSTGAALVPALKVTLGAPVGGEVPVTMDPTGTTDGAQITSYSFNFGDGPAWVVVQGQTAAPQTRMLPLGLYTVTLSVQDASNQGRSASKTIAVGAGFNPYGPTRVMDTRSGIGVSAHPVPAFGTVKLKLPQSLLGTPDSPTIAVVLNVTVTNPAAGGYVTVYPDDATTRPTSSNLNFTPGETVPNQVTVPVGTGGTIDFYLGSGASAQLVADVEGFYTLGTGTGYATTAPTRVLDTRTGLGQGGVARRLAADSTLTLPLPTSVIPASATAVVMNVTVVNPSSGGYLTVYPDGTTLPTSSNLNFWPHDTVPNLVVVPVKDGKIDFHLGSTGSADLVADVSGYYSPTAVDMLLPFIPTRLVDTRQAQPLAAGGIGRLNLAAALGLPTTTLSAVLYNVTVTRPQSAGYLTVFPDGAPTRPTVSNLNFTAGQTIPNAVLTPLTNGSSDFYNGSGGKVDVVVDLFGLFAPAISPDAPSAATTSAHLTASVGVGFSVGAHPSTLSLHGNELSAPRADLVSRDPVLVTSRCCRRAS